MISKAVEIINSHPEGIRFSELVRLISNELPDIAKGTIQNTVIKLDTERPTEIYKPARGIFRALKYKNQDTNADKISIKEEDFYKPFADWIVNELEECTKAIPLGGNKFKDKWGTPDVIGKRESRRSDIVKGPTEIVSAEIKVDSRDLITAFGQACSYKIFSHKSYIVVPKNSPQEDISRLDSLCLIFGIGLILFDSTNPDDPQFEIRVRARKHDPDLFYVNKYMKLIEKELFGN